MKCHFCRSETIIAISNSQSVHWLSCTTCKASGPQKATAEEAEAAYMNVTPPRRPGVLQRLLGSDGDGNA